MELRLCSILLKHEKPGIEFPACVSRIPASSSRQMSTAAALAEAKPDFYKTLGLKPTATVKEIKEAYYRLSKKYHPDRHTGPEAKQLASENFLRVMSFALMQSEQWYRLLKRFVLVLNQQ